MANPLFERQSSQQPMHGGSIFDAMFNQAYQNNPEFRDFANSMKGKTMEEACREKGIDPNQLIQARDNPQGFLSKFGMFGR